MDADRGVLVGIVREALTEHVEDEAEQLARIDRVMERVVRAVERATHLIVPLVVLLAVIGCFTVWALNHATTEARQEQRLRSAEHAELVEVVCAYARALESDSAPDACDRLLHEEEAP